MSIHRALRQIAKITTTADFDTFATRFEKFALTAGLTDEPATAQRPMVAPRPAVAVNVVSGVPQACGYLRDLLWRAESFLRTARKRE